MQPCYQYYNPELPSITFSWECWIRVRDVETFILAYFGWLLKSSATTDLSAVCMSSFTLQSAVRSLCLLFTRNSAVISRGGFTSDASLYCWWSSLIFSFKFTIFFRWSRKREQGVGGGEGRRKGRFHACYCVKWIFISNYAIIPKRFPGFDRCYLYISNSTSKKPQ